MNGVSSKYSMWKWIYVPFVALLCVAGSCDQLKKSENKGATQSQSSEKSDSELVRGMGVLSDSDKLQLTNRVLKNENDLEGAFRYQLSAKDMETACYCADRRGQIGVRKVIPAISEHITLKESKMRVQNSLWLWQEYPAAEALVSIGTPSVVYVTRRMSESKDPKVIEQCTFVL